MSMFLPTVPELWKKGVVSLLNDAMPFWVGELLTILEKQPKSWVSSLLVKRPLVSWFCCNNNNNTTTTQNDKDYKH